MPLHTAVCPETLMPLVSPVFNMLFFMLKKELVISEEVLQNSRTGCNRRTLCTFQQDLRYHKIRSVSSKGCKHYSHVTAWELKHSHETQKVKHLQPHIGIKSHRGAGCVTWAGPQWSSASVGTSLAACVALPLLLPYCFPLAAGSQLGTHIGVVPGNLPSATHRHVSKGFPETPASLGPWLKA